ncbi:MAG: hypothetical protein K0R08_1966 [Solimicrobium sp.]|nr:hypothetical protein [Solimicrobium sp.]
MPLDQIVSIHAQSIDRAIPFHTCLRLLEEGVSIHAQSIDRAILDNEDLSMYDIEFQSTPSQLTGRYRLETRME